nr:retrovirus-related Pol polyprotein from transposon TNT 1-94 [Tanacetum cinerariifolium]
TGLVHTARTRRPQPKGNTRNTRVPSASKSSEVKKNVTVEEHRRTLLLSKNQKTMSSKCNNIKLVIQNDKSEIVCANCKHCLVTANHEACLLSSVIALNSRANKLNDHIAAILGYGDLKRGNITITRVYFVEASPICLMARATPTKSWLWHQRLSYLNFDTINDLAKNDLVSGLPKFKYDKENLCHSCEQGKSKRASHPPKPILNSKQRLHLLHMDLCGPMRVASINDSAPVPSNSSNTPVSSHNVDAPSQQHAQQQRNLTPSPTASATNNVPSAVFEGGLFANPFATPSTESDVSSTQYVDPSNMHTFYQPYPHNYQWIKDHPLQQVIGEPS